MVNLPLDTNYNKEQQLGLSPYKAVLDHVYLFHCLYKTWISAALSKEQYMTLQHKKEPCVFLP